ncbi:MAG: hypothetical protein ACFB51_10995 [Anaerolineae bacterium]
MFNKRIWVLAVVMLLLGAIACGSGVTGSPDTGLGTGATMEVVNKGTVDICYVYISLPTDTTFGEDKLGAVEVISTGASRSFEVAPGEYDIRAESCGGDFTEEYGYSINGTTNWSVALTN